MVRKHHGSVYVLGPVWGPERLKRKNHFRHITTLINQTQMTKQKKTNNRTKPKTIKGRGDYAPETLALTDSAKRLESKIDHLERSLNKKPTVKGAASHVGRALGSLVGQGDLGSMAAEGLAKLFGHGDYHIASNSLIPSSKDFGPGIPKFSNTKRGTRITEREYLGDIYSGVLVGGSTTFTLKSYDVSPNDPDTFPWLSTIANLYDQWEPHGIVFEFISTSSEYNGASQALGTVIMASDYDPEDKVYSTKQEMENSDFACSTKPSTTLIHGLECEPNERPLQIMYCESDQRQFSTLANFQIATTGCSVANVNLGELWVSYDITFYKKQLTIPPAMTPYFNAAGVAIIGAGQYSGTPTRFTSKDITLDNTTTPTLSRFRFASRISSGRFMITNYLALYGGEPNTLINPANSVNILVVNQVTSTRVNGLPCMTAAIFDVTGPSPIVAYATKLLNAGDWRFNLVQVPLDFDF